MVSLYQNVWWNFSSNFVRKKKHDSLIYCEYQENLLNEG